jgi:hypothetical protein
LAQYTLLFEVWDWYKPLAIRERLLPANATRSDAIRLIYEQNHIAVMAEEPVSNRALYDRATKAIERNDINLELIENPDRSTRETKKAQRLSSIEIARQPPLEALLYQVAQDVSQHDEVVRNAAIAAHKALQTAVRASRIIVHHKHTTR